MEKKLLVIFFLLIKILIIYSIKLNYKFSKDDLIIINTKTSYSNNVNDQFVGNSIVSELSYQNIKSVSKNIAEIMATTNISEERNIINSEKKILKEKNIYKFKKDQNGKTYGLESKKGLHDLPRFPSTDLNIGDSWNMTSVFNLSFFNKKFFPVEVEIDIHYQFTEIKKIMDKELALISAYAVVAYDDSEKNNYFSKIKKLGGINKFLIEFDISEGTISSINEDFDFIEILFDNTIIETKGDSKTNYELLKAISKKDAGEIKEKIKEDKDVTVELKNDNSLNFTIENLHFEADTAKMLQAEFKRLDSIGRILSEKYRFNKIIIQGHTADIGNEKQQKNLSIQRARVIYDYLVNKYNLDVNLISYIGKGGKEPIDDNSTEEGKSKNRRVEIIILPN